MDAVDFLLIQYLIDGDWDSFLSGFLIAVVLPMVVAIICIALYLILVAILER